MKEIVRPFRESSLKERPEQQTPNLSRFRSNCIGRRSKPHEFLVRVEDTLEDWHQVSRPGGICGRYNGFRDTIRDVGALDCKAIDRPECTEESVAGSDRSPFSCQRSEEHT